MLLFSSPFCSYSGFQFLLALLSGSIDSFIDILNDISKDYRYVSKVLAVEKKILKAKGEVKEGMNQ